MQRLDRRSFLKSAALGLACLALPRPLLAAGRTSDAPPASLGRIATWWRQAVRAEPSASAEFVAWKSRDEIIPLYAAVAGEAPWPSNATWYQTEGGFIHSGYVHPVEEAPSGEFVAQVDAPGFWSQVCVPIAQASWQPGARTAYKLYYGTVYRVVGAVVDAEGKGWYQLKEGVTYSPGPYVPASSVRRITPEEMTPISPGRTDKRLEINIDAQTLTCLESDAPVFSTPISSGVGGMATPRGEHRVLYKRHAQRMAGGTGSDRYDLPGVAFPVYFTWSGVAIHGTYWHNDYGRRHSHGCVNVTHQAAQWIFRWTDPPTAPYTDFKTDAPRGAGMRVTVV